MRYFQELGAVYWWIAGAPVRVPDWAAYVIVDTTGAAWAVDGIESDESPKTEQIGIFNGWGAGRQLFARVDCMTDSCPIMLTARAVQTWAI